ncbi:MAG: ParB/RepB/Spo0J family partition protein [Eubacteriales bacterium]|nr:ParB/RepB/Spo0J family partition protein [Eubacteriales bacterium]MDY4213874.1 ParB/RepB/Spo0J family partition protein [Eubacteriales bacterium]
MASANKKKNGLGKGVNVLFNDSPDELLSVLESEPDKSGRNLLPIIDIEPNKDQPRKDFDEDKLAALAESIKEHGVISPILVTPGKGGTYKIVAGERRWRASKLAGLKEIPCIIKELNAQELSELAMVENLQRDDLNPIEESEGYRYLMERFSLTQEEIAKKIGKSRSAIANALRLNNLCPEVKDLLKDDKLSQGHARALLTLDADAQLAIAERIIQDGLNVRQTEAIVQNYGSEKTRPQKKAINPMMQKYYKDVENNLSSQFGTKVRICEGSKKGRIEIEYYSKDDLERILFELRK